jgi:hypothetical protein
VAASKDGWADIFQTLDDTRRLLAEFLITELALAMTFLEIASTSNNTETVQRNLKNAKTAYETILRFLPQAILTQAEQQSTQDKLAKVEARLQEFGM